MSWRKIALIDCGKASKATRLVRSAHPLLEGGSPPYNRWGYNSDLKP